MRSSDKEPICVSCSEEQLSYDSDSEGWLVAGKNNKGSVRRTAGSTASNIVTSLFGGIIESQVRVKDRQVKDKSPSVTSHRFTALDLDIANKKVQSVDDALQLYTAKDSISGEQTMVTNRLSSNQQPSIDVFLANSVSFLVAPFLFH